MRALVAFAFVLLVSVSSSPAQRIWKSDPAHSRVEFLVTHMLISEVTGRFNDFDVTLTQPRSDDFAGSTIEATIKMASIDTDNEARDKHLRSDDFFNVERYPLMTFKSAKIEKTGAKTYTVSGSLTIRDVTKPVVLNASFIGELKDPRGTVRAGFKATTSINRFDYGVKWDKKIEAGGFVVGETVEITLLMEMVLQAPGK